MTLRQQYALIEFLIRDCKILQYTVRAMQSTQDMRVIKDD